MSLNVSWLLFDYGGCLDSDGVHSRTLFLRQFVAYGLFPRMDDNTVFESAYTYSDRKVIDESLIAESSLLEMNQKMCFFMAEKLGGTSRSRIMEVARAITDVQSGYLKRNQIILSRLSRYYRLGVISNFSGNLHKILDDFSLSPYLTFILDSFHVGHRKPDPEIFELALSKCRTSANDICFVGDNLDRDIFPAKRLGIKTVLISKKQNQSAADYTFSSIQDLLRFCENRNS